MSVPGILLLNFINRNNRRLLGSVLRFHAPPVDSLVEFDGKLMKVTDQVWHVGTQGELMPMSVDMLVTPVSQHT